MLLWLNQALSQLSYNLLNFSLIVIVYKLTQSTFAVSILIIFFFLPSLFFSLPAGVLSDLLDKKKVMFLADILWAGAVFLIFLNRDYFLGVLLLTFVAKFFDTFFFPAEAASLPQVVTRNNLVEANSLFSFTTYGAMVLGFSMAGPLMRFVGLGSPLIVASVLTSLGSIGILAMNPLKGESSLRKLISDKSFFAVLRIKITEGLGFLKSKFIVLGAVIVSVLGQVFATLVSNIVPEYAEKYLKIAAEDISFVFVLPLALGIVLGLFTLNKFLRSKLKRVSLRWGVFFLGVSLLGLSLTPLSKQLVEAHHLLFNGPLYFEKLLGVSGLAAFFSLLGGLGASLVLVPALTFSQQNIPPSLRGRAFGIYGAVTAFLIIGLVVPLGGLTEIIGVPAIFATMGVCAFTVYVITFKILHIKANVLN